MMMALVVFTALRVAQPMCSTTPSFTQWSAIPTERDYRETIYTTNLKTMGVNTSWITSVDEFSDRTSGELVLKNSTVLEKPIRRSLRGSM
jgi:hypothetical protein